MNWNLSTSFHFVFSMDSCREGLSCFVGIVAFHENLSLSMNVRKAARELRLFGIAMQDRARRCGGNEK